ncbi:MAG: DoxX family protein [Flavobacteriaceae bacterium]|nr:DoxX family protein [Flavobacteriaceae bacterium]
MSFITESILLLFVAITFLQSGWDKITDWGGNVGWLKEHFNKTFIANMVPMSVAIILVLELIVGFLAIIGLYTLQTIGSKDFALYATIIAAICLLMLLFGQRVAKDYDGARTIVIYLIPTVFLLHLLA